MHTVCMQKQNPASRGLFGMGNDTGVGANVKIVTIGLQHSIQLATQALGRGRQGLIEVPMIRTQGVAGGTDAGGAIVGVVPMFGAPVVTSGPSQLVQPAEN